MSRDILIDFYSKPQLGGAFPVFKGARRQIGGSFLSSLARFAIPVLKFLGKRVLGIATNVASDVIDKKMSFRESVPRRAKEGILDTLHGVQAGRGRKRTHSKRRLVLQRVSSAPGFDINTPPDVGPNALGI